MMLFKASLETPNFQFEAYGATQAEAKMALETGLLKHADQYRLDAGWWRKSECDIAVRTLTFCTCYRDGEILTKI